MSILSVSDCVCGGSVSTSVSGLVHVGSDCAEGNVIWCRQNRRVHDANNQKVIVNDYQKCLVKVKLDKGHFTKYTKCYKRLWTHDHLINMCLTVECVCENLGIFSHKSICVDRH